MIKITFERVQIILQEGNFDALIDNVENEFLDCKSGKYLCDNDLNKRELAKDVSSFANAKGGYIVIGPKTKKSEAGPYDVITEIGYLRKNEINTDQYYKIINEWVFPRIDGLHIFWQQSKKDVNSGLFVICIPEQESTNKPFLITKTIVEHKLSEILFGYSERKRDQSEPKKIQAIHALIRDGMNYNDIIKGHFEEIKAHLDNSKQKEKIEKQESFEGDIEKRISDTLTVSNLSGQRSFFLCAYPQEPNILKSIFQQQEGSILRKLEHPGNLRYAGWDLETLDQAKILEGKYVQVCNGDRKTIRLYKDGAFIFATYADGSFLAWSDRDGGTKLNCLAIIEVVYNFVNFYKEVFNDFSLEKNGCNFRFGFNNLHKDSQKSYLCPYQLKAIGYMFGHEKYDAPQSNYFSHSYLADYNKDDVANIAYEVVKEIYLWFGIPLGEGRIPYLKEDDGKISVDIEQIKKVS